MSTLRRGRGRTPRPDLPVAAGERLLAWSTSSEGDVVAGTRDALYLRRADGPEASHRVPWEEVEAADWDPETDRLRVSEVGTWGEPRAEHAVTLTDARRLLELVRERVTASVVLQRHVPVRGRLGVRVIARRAPRGNRPVQWFLEYDRGIDPDDPQVAEAADAALAAAREEVGPG